MITIDRSSLPTHAVIDVVAPNVSVLVLSFNEEVNIRRCLDSVRWSDDVVLVDSFSTDHTVEIAREYENVRVVQNPFQDYGSQRNFGLHAIEYQNEWLLVVDADEAVEPQLAEEVLEIAAGKAEVDVYLVRRKVFMDGKWLRRNIAYDFWIGRLMRPKAVRYEGAVHERVCFDGGYGKLNHALEHHQFTKGVEDWLARRTRYAKMEREENAHPAGSLFSRNTLDRRAALKSLFYRLPARGAMYFAYNFIVKAAFLDGRAGLRYIGLEARSQNLAARLKRRDD